VIKLLGIFHCIQKISESNFGQEICHPVWDSQ